jgi:phenylpropionate dioxygenase-like ring-hydroxylating dioxygenase large terminal subunit
MGTNPNSYPFEGERYVIDKDRYYSRAFMDREWRDLWPKVWLMAGLVVDLQRPGDHVVFDIGPESILLSTGNDGVIRAFHNVCLHRGTRLRECSGTANGSYQCAYHGWCWGFDGKLSKVPNGGNFPHSIERERTTLAKVECEIWAGMVWVHLGAPEQSLREYLNPIYALAAPYHVEDFALAKDYSTHWGWNWKTALDAFSETYHVNTTHPQLLAAVDPLLAELEYYGLHGLLRVPIGPLGPDAPERPLERLIILQKLAELGVDVAKHAQTSTEERRSALQTALRARGGKQGVDYSGLADWQLTDTNQFYIFPNLHLDFHGADSFTIFRYRPHATDPERCTFDNMDFSRRQIHGFRPEHRSPHQELEHEQLPEVVRQDANVMSLMHRGRRSRGFTSPLLHRFEGRILDIHRNIDRYLNAGG